ncbi:MAG: hypothetical protein GXO28_04110 [Methanopyri archaeon]|nr:hypothetical protein [Methanopyri archaeon]
MGVRVNKPMLALGIGVLATLGVAAAGGPKLPFGVASLALGALNVFESFRRRYDAVLGIMGLVLLMVGTAVIAGKVS